MKNLFIFLFSSFSLIIAQTYCSGDQVSLTHQDISHEVCAGFEEYSNGDIFKLSDYNGDLNGGNYSIILIDMSASWWGTCYSYGVPAVDALEQEWAEYGVKFISSLSDPGQPYSCTAWQNGGIGGMPLVLNENQSSTGFFNLFHDSYNAFPTFVILDHTMRVRAKPWNLDNNSNSNSCDGSSSSISGWNGGSTSDFIQQLVNECGDLCINGGCSNALGDLNEDEILNIQDLITMVNHVIGSSLLNDCPLEAADINSDGIVNIQDLISLVNLIIGVGRVADIDGTFKLEYKEFNSNLVININSDVDVAGLQLSIKNDEELFIDLKNNDHLSKRQYFNGNVNNFVAFSSSKLVFDSHSINLSVEKNKLVDLSNINILIVDINGDPLKQLSGSDNAFSPIKFELTEVFPNPFNPSTQVSYNLPVSSEISLLVYNIQGEEVGSIFEGFNSAGQYTHNWTAENLSSGVYYIRLNANGITSSKKALLIK